MVHEGVSRMFGSCVEARAEVEFDRKTWVFFLSFRSGTDWLDVVRNGVEAEGSR